MLTKYANRSKYFFTDTETGNTVFRDKMAERSIKRSYQFKRMEKRLAKKKSPNNTDYLPASGVIGQHAKDNIGRDWIYTANGWETDIYDTSGLFVKKFRLPINPSYNDEINDGEGVIYKFTGFYWEAEPLFLRKKEQIEVVVAHRPKQSLFDLTNKHYLKNWKTGIGFIDNFDDNTSGYNEWGNSKVGHYLENPLGENSTIYGSFDNKGIGINRGGTGASFRSVLSEVNSMSNFVRGFRLGRGSIKWGLALYDEFIPKTQYELDAIRLDSIKKDSVFQNEITPFSGKYLHHFNEPYAWQRDSTAQFGWKNYYPKRKDSLKKVILVRKKMDSIDRKYNK